MRIYIHLILIPLPQSCFPFGLAFIDVCVLDVLKFQGDGLSIFFSPSNAQHWKALSIWEGWLSFGGKFPSGTVSHQLCPCPPSAPLPICNFFHMSVSSLQVPLLVLYSLSPNAPFWSLLGVTFQFINAHFDFGFLFLLFSLVLDVCWLFTSTAM